MFLTGEFSHKINLFCRLVNGLTNEQSLYSEYNRYTQLIEVFETKRYQSMIKLMKDLEEYNDGGMELYDPRVRFDCDSMIAPCAFNSMTSVLGSDENLNIVCYKQKIMKKLLFEGYISCTDIIEHMNGFYLSDEIKSTVYDSCVRRSDNPLIKKIFSKIV